MAPLAIEETLLDIPEVQSSTLMIKGVLSELVSEVEIIESQGDVEEEDKLPSKAWKSQGVDKLAIE